MNNKCICQACGKEIRGRSDKKFCNYLCRNSFHNRMKSDSLPYLRHVNNILRNNHEILRSLTKSEKEKIELEALRKNGFNFQHFTGTQKVVNGRTCYFCYDLGYLPMENGYFALVTLHEESTRTIRNVSQL